MYETVLLRMCYQVFRASAHHFQLCHRREVLTLAIESGL